MKDNSSSYIWILLVGVVVFLFVIIVLLCFTKASGERLFYSGEDSIFEETIVETPALMATLSEDARLSYEQAKSFQLRYPPESIPTDITLSQYVSIQEKGVAAFEFEWDMETTSFVSARTEIQFFSGECCVQTNLPLPRNQEVYYWEAKMFEKPTTTMVSVGVATKPYPYWRLPGWNKHSVGYFSNTGNKHFNNPFNGRPYGFTYEEGDVIGVGYRHRTGTIFFTRNGRKLDEACFGLRYNLFPTIGANGPCQIHVNLGQMGFVFVEANVKKWGLAAAVGTLAPPPQYGYEAGSLLLERGRTGETSHLLEQQNLSYSTQILNHYGSTFMNTNYSNNNRTTTSASTTNNTTTTTNNTHIPSVIEPTNSTSTTTTNSSSSDNDNSNNDNDESDDNTPLIQQVQQHTLTIPIPSPTNPRRGNTAVGGSPTYSPPSYSTFPRLSTLMSRSNSSQEELERNRRAGLI